MNEDLICDDSLIHGKLKIYTPNDVIYLCDKEDFIFKNCIVVYSFLHILRFNFDAVFYEEFTQNDFNACKRQHLCFIIYSTKEDSVSIIEDIKNGKNFRP